MALEDWTMRRQVRTRAFALVSIGLCICSIAYFHDSTLASAPLVLLAKSRVPVLYNTPAPSAGGKEAVMARLRRISATKQQHERLKNMQGGHRRDGRMLVSLAGKGAEQEHHWGEWRTPDNSNAYEGMKEPVHNNNPFGDHVISRDLDKDVKISQLGKYDNPLIDALEGKGLPKMFYEDDFFTPCQGEDCNVVKVSNPVSKVHTHWTGKPRGFGYGGQRDLFIRCSDPTSIYYNEACDRHYNHYGRPLRPGGFPDNNAIVDRHLWAQNKVNPNSYAIRWFPFRHNLSASTLDFRPRGMGIPGNNGVIKTPYTGTGYYGGLSGPPFFTEGARGSEVPPAEHMPRFNFSASRGMWEAMGLGDDAVPAQRIVGHEDGVNDMMYRFRYQSMDRKVFQKNESEAGLELYAGGAPYEPASTKALKLPTLRQTAAASRGSREGAGAHGVSQGTAGAAHRSAAAEKGSLHSPSMVPLLAPTLPPVARLGLEGGLARLAKGELQGRLKESMLAKAQQYLDQARRDFARAQGAQEAAGSDAQQADAIGEEGGAAAGSLGGHVGGEEAEGGGGDEGADVGQGGMAAEGGQGEVAEVGQGGMGAGDSGASGGGAEGSRGGLGEGGRGRLKGARSREQRARERGGEEARDDVAVGEAREEVPIEKVVGAVESVFGGGDEGRQGGRGGRGEGRGGGDKVGKSLAKTEAGLEDAGEEVAAMEADMDRWKADVEAGKAAAYGHLPQAKMSQEGEERLLAQALGRPLPPASERGVRPSGLEGVAVRTGRGSAGGEGGGLVGMFNGVFSDHVTGLAR